jgi:predicted transcriptional regulator
MTIEPKSYESALVLLALRQYALSQFEKAGESFQLRNITSGDEAQERGRIVTKIADQLENEQRL